MDERNDFKNFVWFFFGFGFIPTVFWSLFGGLWCLFSRGIPISKNCFSYVLYCLQPYDYKIIYKCDVTNIASEGFRKHPFQYTIWLLLGGVFMAVLFFLYGVFLVFTLVGFNCAKKMFFLSKLALVPFGTSVIKINPVKQILEKQRSNQTKKLSSSSLIQEKRKEINSSSFSHINSPKEPLAFEDLTEPIESVSQTNKHIQKSQQKSISVKKETDRKPTIKGDPVSMVEYLKKALDSNLQGNKQNTKNVQKNPQVIQSSTLNKKQKKKRPKPAPKRIKRFSPQKNYKSEKEVTENLVIPLIEHLGYSKKKYEAQYHIKAGTTVLISDLVLLPRKDKSRKKAFAVIEVKKSIKNWNAFNKAMNQAADYACLLKARYSIVASQEKVWLLERESDYEKIIYEANWEQLNKDKAFIKLSKYIGRHAATNK